MKVLIIIFIIVAIIVSLASLGYVIVDIIIEVINKKKRPEQPEPVEEKVEEPIVVPVVEEEPEVMPEIVDHIDAEEADALISDELAMKTVIYENGAGQGKLGIINIGIIDANFEPNAVVTLSILKKKGLMPNGIGRLKVLADGTLSKPLTIKAERYSVQTVKMVELTGGTVVILRD